MTNSWKNADGEPIMDGAAWRFECALDDHYDEYDREFDFYEREPDEVDPSDCTHGDYSYHTDYETDTVTNVACDICDTYAVSWGVEECHPVRIVW